MCTLKRSVSKNHSTIAAKVTAKLNTHLENPVSTKTIGRELHKSNTHGTAGITEPLITENNAKRQKIWRDDHKTRTPDGWKYVIWSDESRCSQHQAGFIFGEGPGKPIILNAWFQNVKNGGIFMKIWAEISWYSAGPLITMNGQIIASDYVDILGNRVHPMVDMFIPNNDEINQDDNSPMHTARSVKYRFEEHEDAPQHLPWSA